MSLPKATPERTTGESPAGDRRDADDHAEEVFPAAGPLPASAGRFGITDPQQWIDLCG